MIAPLLLLLVAADSCLVATGGGGTDDGRRFVYNGFTGANLSIDGSSSIMPNGLLMVANATGDTFKGHAGHAFHPFPLPFHTASNATGSVRSFSTIFAFAIFRQDDERSGRHMAFVVSASKEVLSTSPFPPDQFMLSVDLGTRNDDQSLTYVDSMLWPLHYGNAGLPLHYANAGYYDDVTGLFQNLTLINGEAMQVWVDYDGRATVITVTIAPLGLAKPKKPLLHTIIDLSGVAQSTAYVGFSSGGIPRTKYSVLGWSFALDGPAPVLDISVLPALPAAWSNSGSMSISMKIVLALTSVALISVGIGTYIFVRQRLKYSEVHEDWEVPFDPNRFSYKDLFHATEGFSDKNLLGRGGFGSVYKGVLRKPDMEVAVKRMSHDSRQGVKEFIAEVVSIGRLRHRNLTQLLGYCRCKGELLLVYEYMANGSLDKYLHNRNGLVLDWPQRYGIIKGVASSLFYLHEKWEHVVIHRDIKPSNVLLDSQMKPGAKAKIFCSLTRYIFRLF